MICKGCGKYYPDAEARCIFCGAELEQQVWQVEAEIPDEAIGFSKPGSEYMKAEVVQGTEQFSGDLMNRDKSIQYRAYEVLGADFRKEERALVVDNDNVDAKDDVVRAEDGARTEDRARAEERARTEYRARTEDREFSKNETNSNGQQLNSRMKAISKYMILASILLFSISLIIFLQYINKRQDIQVYLDKDALELFQDEENATTFVYNTNGDILHQLKGNILPIWFSRDHTAMLFRHKTENSVKLVDASSVQAMENNQMTFTTDFNGKLIYTDNQEKRNRVVIYDPKKEESTVIAENPTLQYAFIAISPDGKSYAYTTSTKIDIYGEFKTYISVNGRKPIELGNNSFIIALSDDAKYVYYGVINEDKSLDFCVKSKKGVTALTSTLSSTFFNKDLSEILYISMGLTFLCSKGEAPKQIDAREVTEVIIPRDEIITAITGGIIYNFDTFQNKVIVGRDQMIKYIDFYYQAKTLATVGQKYQIHISEDYNSLIYRNLQGELILIENLAGDTSKSSIAADMEDYYLDRDFSNLYYTTHDRNEVVKKELNGVTNTIYYPLYLLRHRNKEGFEKIISSEVADLQLNKDGTIAFFLKRNEKGSNSLYFSHNGAVPELVGQFNKVAKLEAGSYGILLMEETEAVNRFNIYYNAEGTDFKLLLEDVFIMPTSE